MASNEKKETEAESSNDSNKKTSITEEQSLSDTVQRYLKLVQDKLKALRFYVAGVALAMILGGQTQLFFRIFVYPLYYVTLQVVGIALGVGLGLGLATHVYDQLTMWQERQQQHKEQQQQQQQQLVRSGSSSTIFPRSLLRQATAGTGLEDEQTYANLLQAAGYATSLKILRGQVLRRDDPFFTVNYPFTDVNQGKAVQKMQELWPMLPPQINEQLARWIEHILRDYVSSWYSTVDDGCLYQNEAEKRKQPQPNDTETTSSEASRRMVYSMAQYRTIPFLERLYETMAIVFGNLATRVEHVNIFEVVLLKWTRILAHTFKVYRHLRKSVRTKRLAHLHQQQASQRSLRTSRRQVTTSCSEEEKESLEIVSEIAMTKEFLFSGKLHRALTFGLDVPALLFADTSGNECGEEDESDDDVLEKRLEKILPECELDYNRVVGHRMVRALLPRSDFSSPIISSFMTEVLGGCILTPVMSCFCPEYLNSWIIQGLEETNNTMQEELSAEKESESDLPVDERDDGLMRGWKENMGDDLAGASAGVELEAPQDAKGGSDEGGQGSPAKASSSSELVKDETQLPAKADEESQVEETQSSANDTKPASAGATEQKSPATHTEIPEKKDTSLAGEASKESNSFPSSPLPLQAAASLDAETQDAAGNRIITQLAMALIELQNYVDFEEVRAARADKQQVNINWDDSGCRSAILRLVLVIEAALTHGRCTYRLEECEDGRDETDDIEDDMDDEFDDMDNSERPVEVTLPEYESTTLSQILMEMTSDVEAFEERIAIENALFAEQNGPSKYKDMYAEPYKPTSTEQSTVRTLIAAWLHTGQIYRIATLLVQAHATILSPYYRSEAFLRTKINATGFVRQLKALEGVDILVDTMTVLASPRLEEASGEELDALVKRASPQSSPLGGTVADRAQGESGLASQAMASQIMTSSSTPRFFDFHRNEAFAASLRSERERRLQSWNAQFRDNGEEGLPIIYRSKGASEADMAVHRELHHVSRIFYTGTNLVAIRSAARRKNSRETDSISQSETSEAGSVQISLLTVETACPRRRIEVPDDDSSFLLRAQPRQLNAVGVHRDQRNHEQSFKCFAATYEEPALNTGSEHYTGGRFIRRCLIRYYPIDRTASVAQQSDGKRLDQRRSKTSVPDTITVGGSSRPAPFLSAEFLRERHLCQRWVPKGTTRSQSILASSVMEPTDFTATPRSGKAIDFIYRMSFFERPMIDLGGKHFTVHDAAAFGAHRADASALELSDATLSAALLMMSAGDGSQDVEGSAPSHQNVEMGKDGYPIIWMKFSRKQDEGQVEVKPYRVSFVRAALLITAARQEAQLQCLIKCVKAGSAKKATKALTDARLRPALRLVEYAGNQSREKQSLLLRDLKLGVNHIDREQLRRNGLLSPRFPTEIKELTAVVEDAVQAEDVHGVELYGATGVVFKIRCFAVVELIADEDELEGDIRYRGADGRLASVFREGWVVYRTFREFQTFHKHLKNQVSASESSGTPGSRLVGAASAAFAASGNPQARHRQRKVLIPSLSQATKIGALGMTRKSVLKRKDYLNSYLDYLLSPGHLLSRCTELLLFVGAFYPLSPEVHVGRPVSGIPDPLGRTDMIRSILEEMVRTEDEILEDGLQNETIPSVSSPLQRTRTVSQGGDSVQDAGEDGLTEEDEMRERKSSRKMDMIPAIKNKIDKVPLSQVRNRIFELLRYQFGFENASFVRNRMLAAIKTASFAVTSASEFRRTLYGLHKEHVSADALAGWIEFALDLIWPDGIFFESAPPTPPEELKEQAEKAKEVLHKSFPEALRAVLGQELTKDGLDIFHEMLQNRVVVKSMAYMLFDIMWLEVFPEIGDVLPCGAALDIDA